MDCHPRWVTMVGEQTSPLRADGDVGAPTCTISAAGCEMLRITPATEDARGSGLEHSENSRSAGVENPERKWPCVGSKSTELAAKC